MTVDSNSLLAASNRHQYPPATVVLQLSTASVEVRHRSISKDHGTAPRRTNLVGDCYGCAISHGSGSICHSGCTCRWHVQELASDCLLRRLRFPSAVFLSFLYCLFPTLNYLTSSRCFKGVRRFSRVLLYRLSVYRATISFFVRSIVWAWSALIFFSHWKESSSVNIHLKAFSSKLFIVEPRKTWIIHLCLLQSIFTVRVAWYRYQLFDEKISILVSVYRLALYLAKLHTSDLEGDVVSIFFSLLEETTFSSC